MMYSDHKSYLATTDIVHVTCLNDKMLQFICSHRYNMPHCVCLHYVNPDSYGMNRVCWKILKHFYFCCWWIWLPVFFLSLYIFVSTAQTNRSPHSRSSARSHWSILTSLLHASMLGKQFIRQLTLLDSWTKMFDCLTAEICPILKVEQNWSNQSQKWDQII